MALMTISERARLPIIAAADKYLNHQVRDMAELFNDVCENLQSITRPTVNPVIPLYYKISSMGALEELDSLEIALLKDIPGLKL